MIPMRMRSVARLFPLSFALMVAATPPAVVAGQVIQVVNDNVASVPDENVWVMVVGNPAKAASGEISGIRDLSLPTGSVSSASSGSSFSANGYVNPTGTMPGTPFPIQFVSGANAGSAPVTVTAFDATGGTFTLKTALANTPQAGDQFVVGAYSQQLSTLSSAGTVFSKLSGASANLYQFTVEALSSAVIFISHDTKGADGSLVPGSGRITYMNASPAFDTSNPVPFQTVELTTATGGATTADTTVIDYFSIPLQIEAVDSSSGKTVADTPRRFYLSKSTVVEHLTAVGATEITDAAGGLVRLLGPGQVAAANNGSPSPFPSFSGYLDALATQNTTFSVSGQQGFLNPNPATVYGVQVSQYQADYAYDGAVSTLPGGGYQVVLTPQSGKNTITPVPAGSTVDTIETSVNSITLSLKPSQLDGIIYGATLTFGDGGAVTLDPAPTVSGYGITTTGTVTSAAASNTVTQFQSAPFTNQNYIPPFTLHFTSGQNAGATTPGGATGFPVSGVAADGTFTVAYPFPNVPQPGDAFEITLDPGTVLTQFYTNSIYSWVVADVLSALNFGFLGSPTAGDSGAGWYAQFPQRFPYGMARGEPDDGYYNPWAAVFYNASDAYGFAFSDRVSPSPLMSVYPDQGQALRVTVLPDSQLDAPLVTASEPPLPTPTPGSKTKKTAKPELDLRWSAVAGLDYAVTAVPGVTVTLGKDAAGNPDGTAKATGLEPGTPYTFYVKATKGTQESLVLPLYTATSGEVVATGGDLPFTITFTWAGASPTSFPSGLDLYVNGTKNTPSGTATARFPVSGSSGSNRYVLDLQNGSGDSVFKTVYSIGLTAQGTSPTQFDLEGTPELYSNTQPLAPAPTSGPYAITGSSSPLVIGTSFDPAVRKEYASVTVPAAGR